MEKRVLGLRRWLQNKGEIAFWVFPFGMIIDAYGDKKNDCLPLIAYPACALIEGMKIAVAAVAIYFLLSI